MFVCLSIYENLDLIGYKTLYNFKLFLKEGI